MKDVVNISESPCGKFICSSSKDCTVRVWDLINGVELRTIDGHKGTVWGASFLATGRKIVTASADAEVKLWNLDPNVLGHKSGAQVRRWKGHNGNIKCIDVSSDGKTLISCSTDKTLSVWDLERNRRKRKLPDQEEGCHELAVTCVASSKNGKVVSGSADKTVLIWDLKKEGEEPTKIDFGKRVEAVAISSDDQSFYVVGDFGAVRKYDINSGEKMKEFKDSHGHTERVWSVAVTSKNSKLVTGDGNGDIIVWDSNYGKVIKRLERAHSDRVRGLAIAPDDKRFVSGSWDATAKIWSIEDSILLQTFEHPDQLFCVAIHPSGQFLATASKDTTWKLWSLTSMKLLYTSNDAHKDQVRSVVFSPDGTKLISGSFDKQINIEKISHHVNQLPSSVIDHTFAADCKLENELHNAFDWKNSSTASTLHHRPLALVEPSWHSADSRSNLVHKAAKGGYSNFLSFALLNSHNRDKQKLAFFAALAKDNDGRTPLSHALDTESGPAANILLECYSLLLSAEYATPFTPQHSFQEPHPTEYFPLDEFCRALKLFPNVTLKFVSQLSLVTSGDYKVVEGVERNELGFSGYLVGPSQSRVPQKFWKERLRKPDKNGNAPRENGNPVSAKFVPIKDIAGPRSKFLTSLIDAAVATGNFTVFENPVVEVVLEHKWRTYARSMFLRNLWLDILMVVLITVDVLTYASDVSIDETISNYVIPSMIGILWLYFAKAEVYQLYKADSLKDYFKDIWNVGDFLSLTPIAAGYGFRYSGLEFYSTTAFSFALPLTYLNALYYMQGFREPGKLVRMIIRIIANIRYFLIVLTVCMFGFAFAFFTLYKTAEAEKEATGTPVYGLESLFKSLFPPFFMMLGTFDPNEFEASLSPTATLILFVFFMLVMNVVMMNLLIAIMGDTFDQIQEYAMAEYLFCRASIILEFEIALSEKDKSNEEWFPTWLQVLVPTLDYERKEWDGRLRNLKRSIESMNDNVKKSTGEEVKMLKEDISSLQEKLEASEKLRAKEMKEMKQMLNQLLGAAEMVKGRREVGKKGQRDQRA
ncbi:hypothetical protein TrVE_jg4330 [Triparma verrucosa]|uniref:Ion transport domain-containing protein n=1 Tax=Triparma verrucosa TaxID=1606542 RepID=A0A9W7C490_9STRA|nr:hypothetical protein TrVE_jg4330 [Triparma verrucosa]